MTSRSVLDVLLRAALLVSPACACPDGRVTMGVEATRELYADSIDACLADDVTCEGLCRKILQLDAFVTVESCIVTEVNDDAIRLQAKYVEQVDCGAGRRPTGLVGCRGRATGAGAWLARVATIEAASVTAFARLVRELARLGAPEELIGQARAAIADELLHAELTAALARSLGGTVEAPVIAPSVAPTLAQLAIENAVEGQVAETLGAMVAMVQARTATDPEVRAVFEVLARDESRHAALAHQLGAWFEARLSLSERDSVAAARHEAVSRMIADGIGVELPAEDRAVLGLPPPDVLATATRALFGELAMT